MTYQSSHRSSLVHPPENLLKKQIKKKAPLTNRGEFQIYNFKNKLVEGKIRGPDSFGISYVGTSIWRPRVRPGGKESRVSSSRLLVLSRLVSSLVARSCFPSQQQFPSLFFSFSTIFWTSGRNFFGPFLHFSVVRIAPFLLVFLPFFLFPEFA